VRLTSTPLTRVPPKEQEEMRKQAEDYAKRGGTEAPEGSNSEGSDRVVDADFSVKDKK
jgi:hypothetical protein